MRLWSVRRRDIWLYVGLVHCATVVSTSLGRQAVHRMHSLCDCGQYVVGTSGHTYGYFVMATCGELRCWGISCLFRITTRRKIVSSNLRHQWELYGNGVACVLHTWGCLTRWIWAEEVVAEKF